MTVESLIDGIGLALLAACSVGMWTLRVAVAAAGRRLAAAAIAAVEAVLFAVAFGTVITSLDEPVRIVGYAAGVTLGTLAGIAADERLSTGQSLVRLVVDGDGRAEMVALRAEGWPVTRTGADGVRGGVAVLEVAVDDRMLARLRADVDRIAPAAFETTERLRAVRSAPLPVGMHATAAPRHGAARGGAVATIGGSDPGPAPGRRRRVRRRQHAVDPEGEERRCESA